MKYRPTRAIEASYARTTWDFRDFPPETTVQDLLDSDMWCHVAKQWLKPLDEIVVIPQSAPFRAHFIVLDKGDTFAKLKLLDLTWLNAEPVREVITPDLSEITPAEIREIMETLPADAPVSVEWKGPALKFSVVRKSDSERLKTGFAIKAEAEKWAADHLLAMV